MSISLGKTIHQLRKQKQMTQEQLADLLKVSNAAVSKWENDISYPDISILKPLARTLDVTIDALLNFQASLSEAEINEINQNIAALYEEGKIEAAIDESESNLKEYPTDLTLKFHIGSLYFKYATAKFDEQFALNQLTKAKKLFEESLKSNDKVIHEASVHMLISLYSSNDEFDKALALLDTLSTNYQDHRILKSSILYQKGEMDESIKLDQSCVWSEINNISINLLSLANKNVKLEKYEEAIEILDSCFQLYEALQLSNLLSIGINHYILKMQLLIKLNRIDEVKTILVLLLNLYERSQYLPEQNHFIFNAIHDSLNINFSKTYMDRNLLLLLTQDDKLAPIKDTLEYKQLVKKISTSL